MGYPFYPFDLDEYTESSLLLEVARRRGAREVGVCDYCGRRIGLAPACKYPTTRHEGLTT